MKIFKILLSLLVFFSFSFNTFAASAEYQVMTGSGQDVLILGEVQSNIENDKGLVKVDFVFPQTKTWFLFKNMKIRVNNLEKHGIKAGEFELNDLSPVGVGQKYFLSLSKSENNRGYDIQYRPIKVEGNEYGNMEVVADTILQKKLSADGQVFINSGGKETIFSSDGKDVFGGKNIIFQEDCPLCDKEGLEELRELEEVSINSSKKNRLILTILSLAALAVIIKKRKIN